MWPPLVCKISSTGDRDCLVCLPDRSVQGKTFFSQLPNGWPWGEGKEKRRGRTMTGVPENEKDGQCWGIGGNICFKTRLNLARRNVTGGICQKTHSRTDVHGGLSWVGSRPEAGCISVFERAGGKAVHTYRSVFETRWRRGSFYHAWLVFRSSGHGFT